MCKVVLLKSSSRLSLAAEMFGGTDFRPTHYIQEPLTDFHGNEAKKKKNMVDSRQLSFSKSPILNIFCENFMDWFLG